MVTDYTVYRLYKLLDDIDTADDIAKSDDRLYRKLVRRYHKQRHEIVPMPEADRLYDEFYDKEEE